MSCHKNTGFLAASLTKNYFDLAPFKAVLNTCRLMKKLFALFGIVSSLCGALNVSAQSTKIPLRSVTVTLQSVTRSEKSTATQAMYEAHGIAMNATTDESGKFMFGYVPPGVYALGCSYEECRTAFSKYEKQTTSKEPSVQISVNACEGMVCRVSTGKMSNDDWATCSISSAKTSIQKDWSNTADWLQMGGGVMLKVDGAHSVISGKIEAQ
jgi:hypothetical protein